MVRKSLLMSIAVVAAVLPGGVASAAGLGFYTPSVPLHTSGSSPCLTVTQGGASYDPSTGAWTVKPVTVQFTSVGNCI